jgi:DegV family protein with EDD domain
MIKIIADTLSCIPLEQAHQLGIDYIPQIIEFGDHESYRDDTEIDSPTFLKKLQVAPSLPHTAAPPPALYTPIFERLSAEGHTILVICPSAQMSGTVRSAEVAAKDFPNADIRVIDTKSVASGLGVLVLKAHEWAQQGLDADTITTRILEMASRERIFFLVDTLEYLQKGGRIGKAQALFGSLLQVKPILTIKDGHTEPVESQRTKRRAQARLCELVLETCPRSPNSHISVMHAAAPEDANFFVDYFKQALGINDIPIFFLPPAILVHAGPGAVGVSYFTE